MSKKTRKKSSKAAATAGAREPNKSVKKTIAKRGARVAKKTTGKAAKARPIASHDAASKKLKRASPMQAAPRQSVAAKAAAKKLAGRPPADRPESKVTATKSVVGKISEGMKAPDFRLPLGNGQSVSPADYSGQNLVIFFYPRADTPGCTKEAIDFSRLTAAFSQAGTAVLGVSADPPKAQQAFSSKHQLKTPLASDEEHAMLEAYGVWGEKSMYGKTFQGILRTSVLLDRNGKIAKIWRNVKVDGHADAVLEAAQNL